MTLRAPANSIDGFDRSPASLPIGPRDPLVRARMVAIVVLAVVALTFQISDAAPVLAGFLLCLAVAQPLMSMRWPERRTFFFVQTLSDIATFGVIAIIAPEYYWTAALILLGVLGYFAAESETAPFALLVLAAVVAMTVPGLIFEVDDWPLAVAIAVVVWSGLGVLGRGSRSARRATRADLLYAIGEAGGLAHLTEVDGRVVDVIGDVDAVTGWPREFWVERDHRELMHPDDLDEFWVDSAELVEGMLLDRAARFRTADGRWVWLRDVSRVVTNSGRPYLRGFWIDVTSEYGDVERANEAASTDALTGLRNRRFLLSELDRRRDRSGHHLVLIDLNRFKEINDTLGHDAGDDLLCVVSARLAEHIRPGDVLARLGGDEFAIVFDDSVESNDVVELVDQLAHEVARPVELGGVSLATSVSAGIVAADVEPTAATMLRHADIAMYAAKRAGRTSAFFDDEMEADADRRVTLSAGLATALDSGELSLFYQPIMDITTGETVALEGLARWDHPLFGQMAPGSFLDVALMSESSGRFTQVMVERAVEALALLRDRAQDMPVAVNVPIRVLEDEGFAERVASACERGGVSPRRLVFEVAEMDLHDNGLMPAAIERIVALGSTISIDDFGTANATFERLRWRQVEQLKLDRSVVEDAVARGRERVILRSILQLANELGYSVVAEGVESSEQVDLLRSMGCRYAQGFYFAPPDRLDRTLEWIAARTP